MLNSVFKIAKEPAHVLVSLVSKDNLENDQILALEFLSFFQVV